MREPKGRDLVAGLRRVQLCLQWKMLSNTHKNGKAETGLRVAYS